MSELFVSVLFNSFWIVGLALLLAAFSYHYDQAQRNQRALREQLGTRSFGLVAWISTALIGIGLAGTSSRSWEAVIWIAFTVYAAINAIRYWGLHESLPAEEPSPES